MSDTEIVTQPNFLPLLIAAGVAFIFCAGVYPFYIKWLAEKQIGQFIREEGPKSHAAKAKTPTMGGLCFIGGIVLVSFALIYFMKLGAQSLIDDSSKRAVFALLAAALCGLLGFADDFGKIMSKSNAGISAKLRLVCEFGLGLALGLGFASFQSNDPNIFLSNTKVLILFGIPALVFKFVFAPFLMAATSNALNLHDGMDGLCGGTSFFVFSSLAVFLALLPGCGDMAIVAGATAGALLGFLLYNRYRARIFMGDTGSLFLGALMAGLVIYGGLIVWFIPLALIYIIETISVMSQVVYFKLTKPYTPEKSMSAPALALYKLTHKLPGEGKRLFRMAPIHHHFEAVASDRGMKEWEVVIWFWIVQATLCAICLFAFSHTV